MKLHIALSLVSLCSALSLPSFFSSSSSSTTQSTPYNMAQNDYNRQDGQWIWVPNSALRDIVSTNGYNSGSSSSNNGYSSNGYNSNGYNSNGYNSAYNSNGYNNRMTTKDEGNSKIASGASIPNSDTQSRAQTPESGKDASTLENGIETLRAGGVQPETPAAKNSRQRLPWRKRTKCLKRGVTKSGEGAAAKGVTKSGEGAAALTKAQVKRVGQTVPSLEQPTVFEQTEPLAPPAQAPLPEASNPGAQESRKRTGSTYADGN